MKGLKNGIQDTTEKGSIGVNKFSHHSHLLKRAKEHS